MKSRGWAILIAAVGPFYAGGANCQALGPSRQGAGQAQDEQSAMAGGPAGAQLADSGSLREAAVTPVPRPRFNGNPLWATPLESLRMTRERPLFSASRRPPPPIAAAAPKVVAPTSAESAAPENPGITLVGVVHGADVDLGVFVDDTDKSLLRLRVGQAIRGWVVHNVDVRTTTLEKADEQVKLELPARSTETAGSPPAVTVETAASPQPGTAAVAQRSAVGRFKQFATAGRP
ncbi:conserved hypothetical protein [Methylocella tundrae]|uniref:General secretion pathway protein N n=1 Tax=Methylocella tundrae TaxID=227605 RepID=A0A8B6M3J6_METTU|nr:hypothetical protein [Methylocella tundrae]VTZ49386.1 conserved hypothetical protein [Methylocella tundrae]